jgi:hypothetical protein
MILDSHILAFDEAVFVEAFAERSHITLGAIGRPVSNKRYHRQRRFLRVSSERPRRHRAAEKRDELAPPHSAPPRLRKEHRSEPHQRHRIKLPLSDQHMSALGH